MCLVLDVNVWISGLMWGGSPRQILNLAKVGAVTTLVSDPILNELTEVIARPKFQSRMRSLDITIEDLMNFQKPVYQLQWMSQNYAIPMMQ